MDLLFIRKNNETNNSYKNKQIHETSMYVCR